MSFKSRFNFSKISSVYSNESSNPVGKTRIKNSNSLQSMVYLKNLRNELNSSIDHSTEMKILSPKIVKKYRESRSKQSDVVSRHYLQCSGMKISNGQRSYGPNEFYAQSSVQSRGKRSFVRSEKHSES